MKRYGYILLVLLSCNSASERYPDSSLNGSSLTSPYQEDNSKADSSFKNILSYKVIASEDGTFGYTVSTSDKIFIHQPHIPGLPGTKGFCEREDAEKVAQLVLTKIQAGEILPAITIKELKQLGVIK